MNPFIHANAPVVVPVGADRRSAWRARSKVAGRVCSEPLFPEALLIDETVLVAARP